MVENINNIQLRAARNVLGISLKEMGRFLGVAANTIKNHESLKFGEEGARKFLEAHSEKLIDFFAKNKIIFPDNYSIIFDIGSKSGEVENIKQQKEYGEMTRFQLRAARYVINVSQKYLTEVTGIRKFVIQHLEHKRNEELLYLQIHSKEDKTEVKLREWFETNNIEFFGKYKIKFKKVVAFKSKVLLRSEPVKSVKSIKEVMPT